MCKLFTAQENHMLITSTQAAINAVTFHTSNGLEVPTAWYWDHDLYHVITRFDFSNNGEVGVYCMMSMVEGDDYSYPILKREWDYNNLTFYKGRYPEFNQAIYESIVKDCISWLPTFKEITPEWYESFVSEFNKLANS